jgi:hypothetical protein
MEGETQNKWFPWRTTSIMRESEKLPLRIHQRHPLVEKNIYKSYRPKRNDKRINKKIFIKHMNKCYQILEFERIR